MENFIEMLNEQLDQKFLLTHPFYQAWSAGELTQSDLGYYARQYFHHVDAFPRYVSATHANCDDISKRQVLLDNLIDEEKGDENHPELWLRFAESLGVSREEVTQAKHYPETKTLVNTFMDLCKSSYEEGVGALYAYERQVPKVAATKIDGLKKFYGISTQDALKFFEVHLEADVHHSNATRGLLESLPGDKKEKAANAAKKAADVLWDFLSGVQRETLDKRTATV